jgi:ribosomal protein S18 acetylase RimI-like enzyme
MLEFQHNEDLDAAALAEFFNRVGWEESDSTSKVEWAIASSDDWIVCRLEGELVGFGRTFRLDPRRKVMFDVVVDERFRGIGLVEEIIRRLAETLPAAEFQVFTGRQEGYKRGATSWAEVGYEVPEASPDTYTGR